ncbi:MAG: hypothetical protein GX949_05510 [Peptococcaceae bacterium]|jgi:hypothetical protein|nr:hypothetical protein [Peptococcaceae bacterium]
MILYTPMQLELVLEGFDTTRYPDYKNIEYQGVAMVVEPCSPGEYRIVRLLSTNPQDYLKLELAPGMVINI